MYYGISFDYSNYGAEQDSMKYGIITVQFNMIWYGIEYTVWGMA